MKAIFFTLLFNLVCGLLFSQTTTEKSITITKTYKDEKGILSSESIQKKGAAADAFDVEQYIRDNKKEGVSLNVRVENGPDDVTIRQIGDNNSNSNRNCNNNWNRVKSWGNNTIEDLDPDKGFLGVEQDSDEDDDEIGVEVRVQRKGAAAEAGLKNNDLILSLDDVKLNAWDELSDFMSTTKSGQKIKISYRRDGKIENTEAILKKNKIYNFVENISVNTPNVSVNTQSKEACLGIYSSAYRNDGKRGAVIDDFTSSSAAKDATMQAGDVITTIQGVTVEGHQDIWDEIAKFKPSDKVEVAFMRGNEVKTITAILKTCKDKSSRITVNTDKPRSFTTWGWGENEEKNFDRKQVITIRKSEGEGDGEKINTAPVGATNRKLVVENFKAYPSPTTGPISLEFRAAAVPTIVSMYEMSGKQLFREELNAFNGDYKQEFDLSAFAKGSVLIRIEQGEQIFAEQILVN
jgi:membrane-associated protease RseP (regulator of RpoE activity)